MCRLFIFFCVTLLDLQCIILHCFTNSQIKYFLLIQRFSSADILSKVESMVSESDTHLTRVLFCGPHFPASQNYTREYLQKYPFVQVLLFV